MAHESDLAGRSGEFLAQQEKEERIEELLTRGVSEVFPSVEEFRERLHFEDRLNVYMGIDPTGEDLHVGHVSQLQKLERFRRLGHNVTLLIGDFTGMIGDPTDKSATRKRLTREQVLENAATYKEQASRILKFDDPDNPVNLRYNSEWLGKMGFEEVLELASNITVQRMLERDMFKKRIADQRPLSLTEFLYPLMQGHDSVVMDVDVEVGGSDQIFNMLVGRDFVKKASGKNKFVLAGDLLADPSGKKIGKSEGNMVTVMDTPEGMFHKVMMWGDEIVPHALELCTEVPMSEVEEVARSIESGETGPIEGKKILARAMVSTLHSEEAVADAEAEYNKISSEVPSEIIEHYVEEGQSILDVLVSSGLASSKREARRLVDQGGVRVDGSAVDAKFKFEGESEGAIIQRGKKTKDSFRRIIVD